MFAGMGASLYLSRGRDKSRPYSKAIRDGIHPIYGGAYAKQRFVEERWYFLIASKDNNFRTNCHG